ncbi:MAG TPA: MASE3 domain-containing protein [Vicinamibacterales bacterium]|nr:PAS domain S-box protein [Acidobacteriota bacterium]HOC17873.1 MASE3 domain-containing protein [Vicinamibacterales bacterium]
MKALEYWGVGAALLLALWGVAWQNYLLFHALVEFAAIAVAAAMFAVAWNARRFSTNGFLTFLGISMLPVAGIDLFHTLSYRGMGVFGALGADRATQFWIAGRALEAAIFLVSPFFLTRRVGAWRTLLASTGIAVALALSIVPLGMFPTAYVDEGPRQGLTPFKIAAEYVICLVLVAGGAFLWRRRDHLAEPTYRLVLSALVTKILSELAFTQYVSVYGDFNKLGHLLKFVSSYLVFKAVVEGSLRTPYQVLFRDLQQQEETLQASERRYRSLVEMSPDALYVNRDDRIEYANPAAVELFGGTSLEEIVGRSPYHFFHSEYHPKMRERIATLLEGRPVPLVESRVVRLDGRIRDVEVVATPFDDVQGRAIQVILRDITERKRTREELRENARRLEEASRMKDEFLATLSHELRTPLNAILGWSEILLQGSLDATHTRRALEVIARNARAQTALIGDVLDVSRIISGRLRLNLRDTDGVDALRAALDTVRPAAEARRIQVVAELPQNSPMRADPDRLQQVFWNLLSNAVKFTPEGGRIDVSCRRDGDHAVFEVHDTGEGLDPAALEHLFERFWQADRSTSRRHGGLGLGLAIVRHLVELHGGQIRADSEGPGRGATFQLSLPTRGAAEAPLLDESGLTPAGEQRPTGVGGFDGLKVLVVDDDTDARDVAAASLQSLGIAVELADTSAAGLRIVSDWRPDVIVADIGMPGEDGYHFVRQLRALGADRGGLTPAIALTAYSRPEDRRRAIEAGFGDHLPKPVLPHVLAAAIARAAGRTEA